MNALHVSITHDITAEVASPLNPAPTDAARLESSDDGLSLNEQIKINWYRTKVDRSILIALMRKSDAQVIPQLLLFVVTGGLAYLAFLNVHPGNWPWAVPVLLLALFVHGTCSNFFGGIAGHELCHKTPLRPTSGTFFSDRLCVSGVV